MAVNRLGGLSRKLGGRATNLAIVGRNKGRGGSAAAPISYSTGFGADENPISEGGAWGKASNAWKSIRTSGGNALAAAYSNQTGHTDDAYAYLQNWAGGNDYEITATINYAGISAGETEILLRVSDSSSTVTCFELLHNTGGGWNIVRWNGALDDYTFLLSGVSGFGGDGVQAKARIVGNLISIWDRAAPGDAWTQRVDQFDTTANAIASGKPGMGIYVLAASNNIDNIGFKDYSVTAL